MNPGRVLMAMRQHPTEWPMCLVSKGIACGNSTRVQIFSTHLYRPTVAA